MNNRLMVKIAFDEFVHKFEKQVSNLKMEFWQLIETHDGTSKPVLVWDDYWLMRVAVKDQDQWRIDQPCAEEPKGMVINPKYWMPLPLPPEQYE